MLLDLHNNVKFSAGIVPIAAETGNTAYVSYVVDTNGFLCTEFCGVMGSIADTDVTFTVLVEDGDTGTAGSTTLTDNAAVSDTYLLGVEAGTVTSGAAVSGAAPGFADDNKCFKIGYIGPKRYVRVTLTPASNSGNIFAAGVWAQTRGRKSPYSTQVG